MRITTITICAMSLLVGAQANAALPKQYDVLSRKSVFARDRRAVTPGMFTHHPDTSAAPSKPVLSGIVLQEDGCVAVMESTGGGRFIELRPGDKVPDSQLTVLSISLDYMDVAASGDAAPRRVYIGHDLEGAEVALVTTQPTTGPALIEGDDLISRMRRRRQQEMNK